MAAIDMKNRHHMQPLLTWSTNAAYPEDEFDGSYVSGSNGSMTRAQRNQAEKQRRDKLNAYISELATIVPMVAMASKRLDKTSILRLSAAHLRIYQSET
ncbi:Met [Cordylochernes scorpioides]|uniref:Met n=1 Tax=Cordylochernes scorpioides TaxID=51811 RepID=A0ABY6KV22_9ARAC|nr:Met [Cordylochernes scorpioides]